MATCSIPTKDTFCESKHVKLKPKLRLFFPAIAVSFTILWWWRLLHNDLGKLYATFHRGSVVRCWVYAVREGQRSVLVCDTVTHGETYKTCTQLWWSHNYVKGRGWIVTDINWTFMWTCSSFKMSKLQI